MTSLYGYSCLSSSTISADVDPSDDPFDRMIDLYLSRVIECIEWGNAIALLNIYLSLSTQRQWFPNRTRRLLERVAVYLDSPRFIDKWDGDVWDEEFRSFLQRWCTETCLLLY